MRGSRFVYALGLLALGGAVVAQADIKYRVNGGSIVTPSFNNDRAVVNLGAITADAVVHVFDDATSSTTGPSDSLDGIELRADMSGAPGNLKIRLIVGNEDLETDFRPDVTANMAPGVIDFGVEATEAIVYVDTDTSDPDPTKLRDAVILALAVSGNVEGDLSVGRVWRVQASSTSSGNGFIRGNVLASAKDDLEFMPFPADPETRELGEYAINVVTAARGIQGLSGPMKRIESEVGSDSTGGGIARVLVTGASGVVGLQAHVISGKDITAIFTAGPIGETGRVNIYAQRQIEQIRTVTSGGEIVLEAKADVVLRTGVNRFGDLISAYDRQASPMLQEFTGNPSEDAPLGLIEVGGNLEGFIYLVNLAPVPGLPARKAGILVHGVLDAKVQIFYNLDYSKIIAEQILGFVTIGLRMTGVIAEFDREIHSTTSHSGGSLFIGNLNGFEMPEPYAEFTSGMTGIDCTPVEMDVAKWWFETDDCEGGTFDSLIRVGRFDRIEIDRVTLETTPGEHRKHMPRIEFQEASILSIKSMEAGVAWSGDLYEQAGLAISTPQYNPTDPEDHYAKVTTVVIGCVSPTADLWLRDFSRLDVLRDMLGEIHVPAIESNQIIRIGERLGNFADDRYEFDEFSEVACKCGASSEFNTDVEPCDDQELLNPSLCKWPCPFEFEEDSPRGFAGGNRFAIKGEIFIGEPGGLEGQVVINAANVHEYPHCVPLHLKVASSFWTGLVSIPDGVSDTIKLSPIEGDCCHDYQPVHRTAPSTYGGGDVGEIPFRIHYESSHPGYARDCEAGFGSEMVPAHVFSASTQFDPVVRVRYDGPIAQFGIDPPVKVYTVDENGDILDDVSELFEAAVSSIDNRYLDLWAVRDDPLAYLNPTVGALRYRVEPVRGFGTFGEPFGLMCDDNALINELTTGGIHVSDETFDFVIFPDCNDNGIPDAEELILGLIGGAVIDCDGNGQIDACEILANGTLDDDEDGYLDICQGACMGIAGDFNCDSEIDALDLMEFIEVWFHERGLEELPDPSLADVNGDEEVNVLDLIDFVYAWINQCECE